MTNLRNFRRKYNGKGMQIFGCVGVEIRKDEIYNERYFGILKLRILK